MKRASKSLSKSSFGMVPSNSLNLKSKNLSKGSFRTTSGNLSANLLKRVRNLSNRKVLLYMKHGVPISSPLLNASYDGFILPNICNFTQMMTK
ncbi:hypothetical protein CRYUN_Cryun07bG0066300 [Craigia yunnanensis]